MMNANDDFQQDKISPGFSARLGRLGSQQKVRAMVLLRTPAVEKTSARRPSRVSRQATIAIIRQSAEPALLEIDRILERFDGQRLAASADALGCVPIETTAAGITALAASEHVKAILEDQPISLLH